MYVKWAVYMVNICFIGTLSEFDFMHSLSILSKCWSYKAAESLHPPPAHPKTGLISPFILLGPVI